MGAMNPVNGKDTSPLRSLPSLSDLRGFVRWLLTGRLP